MKVCVYSHFFHPSTGGVESATLQLADYLSGRGVKAVVVTQTPESGVPKGFRFKVVRRPTMLEACRIVAQSDIVYTMGFNLLMALLAILHRKPLIWDHPDHDLVCPKNIAWNGKDCEFSMLKCLRCLCRDWPIRFVVWLPVSLMLRKLFSRLIRFHVFHSMYMMREGLVHLPRGTSIVRLPYGVSSHEPSASKHHEHKRIFFFGRLIPEKGCQILIRAIKGLEHEDVRLDVVGEGWFKPYLEEMVKALGLSGRVTFHGKLSRWDVNGIYKECDIVVVPSLWNEPFGQVAVEAMIHGKPVIVSSSGGLPEVIGEGGLVFRGGDHKDLAEKIRMLLGNPELASELVERGYKIALQYSMEIVGENYLKLLKQAR